jgi:glycosyltransferase involved in cell wall biosynthesis
MRGLLSEEMWYSTRSKLLALAARSRPDVILSYWLHPDGAVASRLARESGVPCLPIVGGSDVLVGPRSGRRARSIRDTLRDASAVIAVSETLRRAVMELVGARPAVYTVCRGINPMLFRGGTRREARERLGLAVNAPLFVWVGRMVPLKRLDILLDAWPRVVNDLPLATLALIGEGPERARHMNRLRRHSWARSVRFVGGLPPAHLSDWYRAADATVLCSDSEGLPNVLRESLACGTPYVATDVGGTHDLERPLPSLLVPPGDPEALALGMMAVARSGIDVASSIEHSPRTWDDMAAELTGLIAQVLGALPPPDGRGREGTDLGGEGITRVTGRALG